MNHQRTKCDGALKREAITGLGFVTDSNYTSVSMEIIHYTVKLVVAKNIIVNIASYMVFAM